MKNKTIFIPVFEGVEAKNILRTDVIESILKDPGVRVVIFVKSEERADYYKKEFKEERIVYEVVEKPKVEGLDVVFSKLKFMLLRTETTLLKRRMKLDSDGKYAQYYFGLAINYILARPFFRKIARVLDLYLVKNNTYEAFFDKYHPDMVFCSHLFDEPEVHMLREAKKRGVFSVGFVNSWDKITARCILRILPDRVIVFNEMLAGEMAEFNEVKRENIMVSGLPHYDYFVSGREMPRGELYKKYSMDPARKFILATTMGPAFSDSDWEVIDLLYKLNLKGSFGEKVEILVRFKPNDAVDEAELNKRPFLKYQYPGIRFSSKMRGFDWDMSNDDMAELKSTLRNASLIIGYASSISVEAAFLDTPIINFGYEVKEGVSMIKSPTQYFYTHHYRRALESGGIRLVKSEKEMVDWIRKYLNHPEADREGRKKLVLKQCQFTDGKSGERIGKYILGLLKENEK